MDSLLFLAFALVVTEPTEQVPSNEYAWLMPVIQGVAFDLELLDQRERNYLLGINSEVCRNQFGADLRLLQSRWANLKDAPPLSDSIRLPNRQHAMDARNLNAQYRVHLEREMEGAADKDAYKKAISEALQLYIVWDYICDAKAEWYYATSRRTDMKRIRALLGENDYYSARFPNPVPLHRFQVFE